MTTPANAPLPELDLFAPESGPKRATSLLSRNATLLAPAEQLRTLAAVDLRGHAVGSVFDAALAGAGWPQGLTPTAVEVFQINIGKLCNMTCRHCHVDAGPDRTAENMDRATVDACLAALDRTGAHTVDITGGAPELNPHFRYLVEECARRGKHVIDRCNLTILMLPRSADLPAFFAQHGVEVVCSLPHYRKLNTDRQRGDGTFDKSVAALRILNRHGYGTGDPKRRLTLMMNPAGAFLPESQAAMESDWKTQLAANHSVTFDRLVTLNNMPISRFLEWLQETGNLDTYMHMLLDAFNPASVSGLMCRNTLSIGWDGRIYDCDFNQQLEIPSVLRDGTHPTIATLAAEGTDALARRRIATDRHCFGCTAGAGSSCGGQTA